MFQKIAIAAALALVGTSAHAYDFSGISDATKVSYVAGISIHKQVCNTPQSDKLVTIFNQLTNEVSQADVKTKSTEMAGDMVSDVTTWCESATKTINELEAKADTLGAPAKPATPPPTKPAPVKTESSLPDYSDKAYTCDKDRIQSGVATMIDRNSGYSGTKVIYVKNEIVETSRKPNELRCRITVVTTHYTVKGIYRFVNEDGHALVGWLPAKTK